MALKLKEVTIYSNRMQKKMSPVQILSGKELEKLNVYSVADALRYFSGVQIKDYGGIGGLKTSLMVFIQKSGIPIAIR